jgi:hypothetical protein
MIVGVVNDEQEKPTSTIKHKMMTSEKKVEELKQLPINRKSSVEV